MLNSKDNKHCGCNKYTIKYIGEMDEQNYVTVHTDSHKNGQLMAKSTFLHNTKLSSKYNEEKLQEKNVKFPMQQKKQSQ